ncbi:MAG: hypothetical protein V1921_07415 [Candidatus Altiarchaeota archaeon]
MMAEVGVFVVTYGSRGACIVDALKRSGHNVRLYIADKQKNPFNVERAEVHKVIPKLDVPSITDFVGQYKEKIDFGFIGPEGPIVNGVRDEVEAETGIPVICPTKEYAYEESKVLQREMMADCAPEANPRFKVFRPADYGSKEDVKKDLYGWLDELENQVAVKPDLPGYGKGVGVWGDHFKTREEVYEHFMSNFEGGTVLVEEKIAGEESSLQCFSDGKHLVPAPDVRDYKRAFDGDRGPNTGGMGSYKSYEDRLPFMSKSDRESEVKYAEKIFNKVRGKTANPGLRGIPFYLAFMHGREGQKILEINSRLGDPEAMNIVPLIKDDFVDVCYNMIEGKLKKIDFEKKASVVTYKVPPSYGGYDKTYPSRVLRDEVGKPVELASAAGLVRDGRNFRLYPGSMELRDGKAYALGSRAVACVGFGADIEEARTMSLNGVNAIKGGGLWNRGDIASEGHIRKSVGHLNALRG